MNLEKYLIILLIFIVGCQKKTSNDKKIDSTKIEEAKKPKFLTESIDTLINSKGYLVIGNKSAEIEIIKVADSLKFSDFKIIDFKNDILFVAKNLDKKRFEVYEKYNPKVTFSDFKVKIYNGELVEPDFEKFPWAKRNITRIKEECKNGINFAGKYTLVIWGCGSPCQSGVIVDRTNGKIYNDYFSTYGSEYKKDSSLIIFNSALIDEKTQLMSLHNIVEVSTEIWNGTEFKKI
ncbi:hypothetical protein [Marixanthomonas spongiae]|uniref:Lipoprotein n=1 Tax=Marixanthomonas spongiae TaxID=2174845 RepID=A0A2U0HRK7_9FLAO|nr:hypothetical protein [Marixanthomonas spongiae]PVW11503.1 hypothetical protein DDV96_15745 [Marixanthomonas spongiae]